MGKTRNDSVKATGAMAGSILVGCSPMNEGTEIELLADEREGNGGMPTRFRVLKAGGEQASIINSFIGRDLLKREVLNELRNNYGKAHPFNMNSMILHPKKGKPYISVPEAALTNQPQEAPELVMQESTGTQVADQLMSNINNRLMTHNAADDNSDSNNEQLLEDPERYNSLQLIGAGFGDPDTNTVVESAAVEHVSFWYQDLGWDVQSVEQEKRGYDLICRKDSLEEHVEVKGTSGTGQSFIITAGEVRQAKQDPLFVLCLVTSALSDTRSMFRYPRRELAKKFKLDPIAYKASLK